MDETVTGNTLQQKKKSWEGIAKKSTKKNGKSSSNGADK